MTEFWTDLIPPLTVEETARVEYGLAAVGVTSIAADPQWTDRGEERFHDYWQRTGFGDLLP